MYAVLKRSNRLVFCLFLFGSVLVSATYFLWNVERIGRAQASGISTEAKPEVSEKRFPETLPFDWRRLPETSAVSANSFDQSLEFDLGLARTSKDEKERRGIQALRFRLMQLRDENGKIPEDALKKAKMQADRMRSAQDAKARAAGKDPRSVEMAGLVPADWSWLGPGNIGGRTRAIVIDPNNADNMWAGSVGGGIWKTHDGGASWIPVDDFMANLAISSMVLDPSDNSVMYAGTGEGFADRGGTGSSFMPDGLRGLGVFKSIDWGNTWTQLSSTDPSDPAICPTAGPNCAWSYVYEVAISPSGGSLLAATRNGIWRSLNDGQSWTQVNPGLWFDVRFHPGISSEIIAAGANVAADGTLTAIAAFSSDGGNVWQTSRFTDAAGNPMDFTGADRMEFAYAPSTAGTVAQTWVYAALNRNQGELYLSQNGGRDFRLVNTGTMWMLAQGFYDNTLWVNPQDPSFVVVGGIDLWKSTDAGTTLEQISRNVNVSAHPDHHVIVSHPGFDNSSNKTVFFASDGGVYKTDDISTADQLPDVGWIDLNNGYGVTQFYGAAANANKVVVGGTQDNGNVRFNGDPTAFNAWTDVANMGGDGGYVAADPFDVNYFYGEYVNLQLRRSTDGGLSGTDIFADLGDAGNEATTNFIAPFILDPNNASRLLAGGLRLWRSEDIKAPGQPEFDVIKPQATPVPPPVPPPAPTPTPTPVAISAIAVAKGNSNLIVVGHNDGQIYITENGTAAVPNWIRVNNGTPGRFVTRLVIDERHEPAWIYATFGGFSDGNVWRTTNKGATWTDVSGTGSTSLPFVPVRGFAVSFANPNLLYAGTETGVFVSEDAGSTWLIPQGGPANVSVDELFWHNGNLVAVTHGRGVYTTRSVLFFTTGSGAGGPCGNSCDPLVDNPSSCDGRWGNQCCWANKRVPTLADDVVVACNLTGAGAARNLSVNATLSIDNLIVAQNIFNFGNIISSVNGSFPHDVVANNVFNIGNISVRDVKVQAGDIANHGTMSGRDLIFGRPMSDPFPGNLSGIGAWQFERAYIPPGTSAALSGPISMGALTFRNEGVFDVRSHNITFNGSLESFSDNSEFKGVLGTGLVQFAPTTTGNRARFIAQRRFQPPVRILSGDVNTYVYDAILGVPAAIGPVTVDTGATMSADTAITFDDDVLLNGSLAVAPTCPSCTPYIDFNGDTFTNNGSVGPVNFFRFNASGTAPRNQRIIGTGTWAPKNTQIGGNAPSTTSLSLANDVIFSTNQFQIFAGSTLDLTTPDASTRTLSINTPASIFNYGNITGDPGRFMLQPATGFSTLYWDPAATLDANLHIAFGEVRMSGVSSDIPIGRDLRVEDGATFTLGGPGISVAGIVQNNGTINTLAGLPVSFNFTGSSFFNNGTVSGSNLHNSFLSPNAGPVSQTLTGTGSWGGAQFYVGPTSTVGLGNFTSFNGTSGSNIFIEGRINTGNFSLSVPCAVTWMGSGDVFGNVRRTSLAACSGPVAYGNPFTTIQFSGGTSPDEVTVNVNPAAPPDFLGAILRTYVINAVGGSGWTSTLRLHYNDSELNGNDEATLNMYRNDGSFWNLYGPTSRSTTENWVQYAGVTQFSPWMITSLTPPPAPNTPPTLGNVAVTSPINEGGTATLTGTISDPNAADTFSLNVTWGDGSQDTYNYPAGTTSFSQTHVYADNPNGAAQFSIGLTLRDNQLGSAIGSAAVTVANVDPTISALSATPSTVNTGVATTLNGTLVDPGTGDAHGVGIDWGDGTTPTQIPLGSGVLNFSSSHTYSVAGAYTITVAVTDDDNGLGTRTTNVTVTVAPPAAPSNLIATGVSKTQIDLRWTDNSNNETGFRIVRCANKKCASVTTIGTVAENVTTFSNTGLAANTSYLYRVIAFNSGGDSAPSNIATGKTLRR